MDKNNGKEVIDVITGMANELKTPNKNICYDADGVGSFIDGFIVGSIPFNNGGTAFPNPDLKHGDKDYGVKENYPNLKTQCYYRSGDNVSKGKYKVSEEVANTMYDNKMTVKQRFMHERRAIKRKKADMDGKLQIIGKDEMKAKLNGDSPDLMDMFMIRERFDLDKAPNWFVV